MPPRWMLAVVALALVACPVARAASQPAHQPTVEHSRHLWATVNVCDTAAHPDTIGIRGSMPGAADGREIMWMRFQAQFFSQVDAKWHNVSSGGDSGFVKVGPARYKARQAGRSFRFNPQPEPLLLRGVVTFEWRLNGEVVRRARERTTKGHKSTAGSDPEGYTASNCTIAM